jgi:hypothetical protein
MLRPHDDDRLAWAVFGCYAEFVACHINDDGIRREFQRIPGNGNFPAADSQKTAEINHGGAHVAGAAGNDIGDLAELFSGCAFHIPSKKILNLIVVDDDGWRAIIR